MSANIQTIQAIYEAFGRGDAQGVLDRVASDVRWGYNVEADDVPWHQPITARADLGRFFASLAEHVDIDRFEPLSFLTGPQQVAVHLRIGFTVRRTGRRVDMDHLHLWTLDADGKVASLIHFEDTAQVAAAWR